MSKIDYPLDMIKAVVMDVDGVLSPATVPMDQEGRPARMANIRDGYAIQLAAGKGLTLCILSGAIAPNVEKRYKGLGIDDVFLIKGDKLAVLKQWMQEKSLLPEQVAYIGDDIPDYRCMQYVGLPVAPHDCAPEIMGIARFVSQRDGGYGVARELLEEILKVKGLWPLTVNANGK